MAVEHRGQRTADVDCDHAVSPAGKVIVTTVPFLLFSPKLSLRKPSCNVDSLSNPRNTIV